MGVPERPRQFRLGRDRDRREPSLEGDRCDPVGLRLRLAEPPIRLSMIFFGLVSNRDPVAVFSSGHARRSNERMRSAILNCICPECGGGLSLAADQLRCKGWCGTDWWPVWIRIRKSDRSQSSHRLMHVP